MQVYLKGYKQGKTCRRRLRRIPTYYEPCWVFLSPLIFLLGYAVYGATISPSYYLYTTDTEMTVEDGVNPVKLYDEDENITNWRWTFTADGDNLTWVNVTAGDLSRNSVVKLTNSAGLYSHTKLGDPDADDFSCADSCYLNSTHELTSEEGGDDEIVSMTTTDPGRRNNGYLYMLNR